MGPWDSAFSGSLFAQAPLTVPITVLKAISCRFQSLAQHLSWNCSMCFQAYLLKRSHSLILKFTSLVWSGQYFHLSDSCKDERLSRGLQPLHWFLVFSYLWTWGKLTLDDHKIKQTPKNCSIQQKILHFSQSM